MYYKGANLLHIIRTIINNDKLWLDILRGLNKDLGLTTTTTEEVVNYINNRSGKDLTKVFDQYLRFADIPVLELRKNADNTVSYRWKADVKGFNMPVNIRLKDRDEWIRIQPNETWRTLKSIKRTDSALIDTLNFYIEVDDN